MRPFQPKRNNATSTMVMKASDAHCISPICSVGIWSTRAWHQQWRTFPVVGKSVCALFFGHLRECSLCCNIFLYYAPRWARCDGVLPHVLNIVWNFVPRCTDSTYPTKHHHAPRTPKTEVHNTIHTFFSKLRYIPQIHDPRKCHTNMDTDCHRWVQLTHCPPDLCIQSPSWVIGWETTFLAQKKKRLITKLSSRSSLLTSCRDGH